MKPSARTNRAGAVLTLFILGIVWIFPGCTGGPAGTKDNTPAVTKLKGGGSTFVGPMMDEWTRLYKKEKGVSIDYTRGGSGMGISKVIVREYDFGCTDAPMTDKEKEETKGEPILHIPLVMGSLVPAYNLEKLDKPLKFTGTMLSKIYLGQIKKWNDPELTLLNPELERFDQKIVPVRRSDPSGSTFIWTSYLSKVNDQWKNEIGSGKDVTWPANLGVGAPKTDGVAGAIAKTPGAIGYIEVQYALKNELKFGTVRNRKGKDISGEHVAAVTAAAAGSAKDISDDLTFMLTDADGEEAYPICGAVWAVVYQNQSGGKGKALTDFLAWIAGDGQKEAAKLHYAPLPADLVARISTKLKSITDGKTTAGK